MVCVSELLVTYLQASSGARSGMDDLECAGKNEEVLPIFLQPFDGDDIPHKSPNADDVLSFSMELSPSRQQSSRRYGDEWRTASVASSNETKGAAILDLDSSGERGGLSRRLGNGEKKLGRRPRELSKKISGVTSRCQL